MSLRTSKKIAISTALMGLALLISSPPAPAAEPQASAAKQQASAPTKEQLIASGQELAKSKCGSCHSIDKQGDSPLEGAPPFRSFASKWPLSSLEESLAEGIVTGHEAMPEVVFTPQQIDQFLEFLESLQGQ